MATNPPINATGIVGTDNVAPVYNPNGGWQIHNFNDIYTGQQGYGKVVPLVGDEVHNPVGTTIDIYVVTAIDPLTLVATLTQVTDSNAGNGTGDITPADVLLGTGTTTQPSTFTLYYDDSTMPYGLVVDARYTVHGSMCQTCKIFKGNYLSSSTDIISLVLDASGNIISEAIPLQLVGSETVKNIAIKAVPPAYTNAQLVDGELVTAVFYDANGSVVSKQQMIVESTSWIIQPNAMHKYIVSIDLESPFISPSNGNLLQFPLNVTMSGLDLMGVVTYSDGSKNTLPVDDTKFSIYGLAGYMSTQVGQQFEIVLKYTLGPNESSMKLQVGANGQISKTYGAMTMAIDNAYSFKLYGFPNWQSQALGYGLQWFLYDMNRNISYDVSDKVVINTNFEPWQPKAYGILQTLNVSIDVSLADPSFSSYVHAETAEIVLNGIGDQSGYYPWSVAFTPGQNPRYSAFALGTHQLNNTVNWELDISNNVTTLDTWLATVYYPTVPLFDSNIENAPPPPTHFNIISNGVTTRFPVSAWNSKIAMGNGMPEFTNIIIEFVMATNTGDLQLSVAAMPVIDTGLIVNNLNNNNTVIGGNGIVIPQPSATAFSIQCLETVGGTTLLNNDSSGNAQNLVMGTYAMQAVPTLGYLFSNWSIVSGAGSCQISDFNNPNATVFIDGNVVLQANYTTKTATVQAINGAGGLETTVNTNGSGAPLILPIGQYPITATSEIGFQFVNWTLTGNCAIIDLSGNATTPKNNPDGSMVPGNYSHNTGTETVAIYGDCTITANYSSTNVLVQIGVQTDTGGTDTATTVSLTGDKTTTLNQTVTGSSIQTTTNYANYNLAIANLDPNMTFVNWEVTSGKAVIVNPNSQNTQVSISGPVTIMAIVKSVGFKVSFNTLPGFGFSTGMTFNGQPVTATSVFTVPAGTYPINAGTLPLNQFSIWTGVANYAGDVTSPNCQVVVTGDTVVTPEFVPYSNALSLNINMPYVVTINGTALNNGGIVDLDPGAYPIHIADANGNPVGGTPTFSVSNILDPNADDNVQVSEYAGATLNFVDGCTLNILYNTSVNICTFSTQSKSDISITLNNPDGTQNVVNTGANKLAGGFVGNAKLQIGQSYNIAANSSITDSVHELQMNFVAFETSDTTGSVTITNKNDPNNAYITFNDNSYNGRDLVIYAIYSPNYNMLELSNAQQIWTTVSKNIPNGAVDDFTWLTPLVTGQEWVEGTGYAQFGGIVNAPMCVPITSGTYTINAAQPYQSYQGDMSSEVFAGWTLTGDNATLSSTSTPLTTLTVGAPGKPPVTGAVISLVGLFNKLVLSPATLSFMGSAPTNGTITVDGQPFTTTETIQPGNHVLVATPAAGYKFQSWTLNNISGLTNSDGTVPVAGNPATNSLAALNLSITNGGNYGLNANFVANSFNLNFAGYPPDNGSITVDGQPLTGGIDLSIGKHTITAVPNANFTFAGWNLAGPSTNTGVTNSDGLGFLPGVNNTTNPTMTINGNTGGMYDINAVFKPKVTVTFPAEPNVTWVTDNVTGNNNAIANVVATSGDVHSAMAEFTAPGYVVSGWTATPASAVTFPNGSTGTNDTASNNNTIQYVATADCTITPLIVTKTTANVTLMTDTSMGSPNIGITANTNGIVFGSGATTSTGWSYNGNTGKDAYTGVAVGIYPVTLTPPTAGYVFDHWAVTGGITVDNATSPNANITIVDDGSIEAICKAAPAPTVNAIIAMPTAPNAAGTITIDGNVLGGAQMAVTGPVHNLVATPADGYVFSGWSITSTPNAADVNTNGLVDTDGTVYNSLNPNVTLTIANGETRYVNANWTSTTFTIAPTTSPTTAGTITVDGVQLASAVQHVADGKHNVLATPGVGYTFGGWQINDTSKATNADGSAFDPNNPSIIINGNGGDYITVNAIWTSLALTNANIQLNGPADPGGTITLDSQSLTGSTSVSPGKHQLVATPTAGYSFVKWVFGNSFSTGAANTDGSAFDPNNATNPNITIDTTGQAGNTYSINAVWSKNTFSLILNGGTITNGAITVDGQPLTGTTVLNNGAHNLVAVPAAGYVFSGWTFGSGIVSGITNTDGTTFTYPGATNPAITINSSNGDMRYINATFTLAPASKVPKTLLMMNMDGPNGSTTFTDVMGNTLEADRNSFPTISTVNPISGTGSAKFTGNNYIGISSLNNWNNLTDPVDCFIPWSVECKFNSTSTSSGALIDNYATNGAQIFVSGGKLEFWYHSANFGPEITVADGINHHVAMCSDGTTVTGYLDGNPVATTKVTASSGSINTNTHVAIGTQYNAGSNSYLFNGTIDDVRIVHGAAVYTGAFAPNVSIPLKAIYAYDPTASYSAGDPVFNGTSVYYAQSDIVGNASNAFTIGTGAGQFALNSPIANYNVITGATNGNATVTVGGVDYSSGGVKPTGTYPLVATPKAGFLFNGWTVTSGTATITDPTNSNTTVTINGNCSILANMVAAPTISVLVQCVGSRGSVSLNGDGNTTSGDSQTLVSPGTYPISFTPSSGNQFNGWSISSGTGVTFGDITKANTTINIAANATNSVLFADGESIPMVTVMVQSTVSGGLVSINGDAATNSTDSISVQQSVGGTYPISFKPNPGFMFNGWSVTNGSGMTFTDPTNPNTTIAVAPGATDGTIMANSAAIPTYSVFAQVAPGQGTATVNGVGSGSLAAGTYPITATPAAGYVFDHWAITNGDGSIDTPNQVNANYTLVTGGTIQAVMNVAPVSTYTITLANFGVNWTVNGNQNNPQVLSSGTYPINVGEIPAGKTSFGGWVTTGDISVDNPSSVNANLTVVGAGSLSAVWN